MRIDTDTITRSYAPSLGARPLEGGVDFRLWAPGHQRVEVVVHGGEDASGGAFRETAPLQPEGDGWFSGSVPGLGEGDRYRYRLDGRDLVADPASRFQPEGVDGPSEIVDPDAFRWTDGRWRPPPLAEWVLYEVHVGTATADGTFEGLIPRLDDLVELGADALEIMPVAQFPGRWNWGYDGAYPYAPAVAYGGPEGLRRLIDAAHAAGIAVVLDVVYNHLGPAGCDLPSITGGRIFSDRHHTPWGAAINFDGPGAEGVREFFIQNALHWIHEYHVDGLRLDAVHAIRDESETHVLRELAERVHASATRPVVLIAEDERNERRLLLPHEEGGIGMDAVWADDFHHELRRLLAGDDEGYFRAYAGTAAELAETVRKGWLYEGQSYAPTGEPRGTPADDLPPRAFVHCIQNHDQVGNRAMGERLNHDVDPASYRAASALLLLSPYTPLLWMGQEWAASTPFLYFTDHSEELGRKVTAGRREEFAAFSRFADPALRERIPDPQSQETFERSRLLWDERRSEPHRGVLLLYQRLLALRRDADLLRDRASWSVEAVSDGAVALRREAGGGALVLVASFGSGLELILDEHETTRALDTASVALSTEEEGFGGDPERVCLQPDHRLVLRGPAAVVLRSRR